MLKHGRTVFEQDEQYFLEVLHSLFPVTLHDRKKIFRFTVFHLFSAQIAFVGRGCSLLCEQKVLTMKLLKLSHRPTLHQVLASVGGWRCCMLYQLEHRCCQCKKRWDLILYCGRKASSDEDGDWLAEQNAMARGRLKI